MPLEKGFLSFSNWIEQRVGIHLGEEKISLVQARLGKRLEHFGCESFDDYQAILATDPEELKLCIESLTTHKTEWFREIIHFQWLKPWLEERKRTGGKVHLWSAACSTGLEPYSLLFLCLKIGLDPSQIRILGTDLSERALQEARELPLEEDFARQVSFLKSHISPQTSVETLLNRALSDSIKFRPFNLISDKLPPEIQFDVIFLRNVLIYFGLETKTSVCQKLKKNLKPGGHLILGLSESMSPALPEFQSLGNAIYRSGEPVQSTLPSPPPFRKAEKKIRTLIVEDSEVMAKVLRKSYAQLSRIEVIGTASSVSVAKQEILRLKPDLISLDMMLLDGTGLDLMRLMEQSKASEPSLSKMKWALITECSPVEGGLVLDALDLGASAYLQKPVAAEPQFFEQAVEELVSGLFPIASHLPSIKTPARKVRPKRVDLANFDLIAIGSSTGGTEIVKYLLTEIPKNSPPIVVVQHMPEGFTELFANRLEQQSGRPTLEVREKTKLESGRAYIAAGGLHLTIKKEGSILYALPVDELPIHRFKPSISRLFSSIAERLNCQRVAAIMLTGMGQDGAQEMLKLREQGAYTLGQSPETCAVYGMPRAAAELGALCAQASPEEMVEIFGGQATTLPVTA